MSWNIIILSNFEICSLAGTNEGRRMCNGTFAKVKFSHVRRVLAFIAHTFRPLITNDRQRLIQPFNYRLVTLGKLATQKLTHILKRVLSIVRIVESRSTRDFTIARLYIFSIANGTSYISLFSFSLYLYALLKLSRFLILKMITCTHTQIIRIKIMHLICISKNTRLTFRYYCSLKQQHYQDIN